MLDGTDRIGLILEYDGTGYCGFQWQADHPTVQGELEKAIEGVTGERKRVIAASRTDAGVHARGQVASFWTKRTLPPRIWERALNYYLPEDIAVRKAFVIPDDFNIRHDAVSREYKYYIVNRNVRSPITRRLSHFVATPLDVAAMSDCCRLLEGRHDFASFATRLGKAYDTVRNIYEAAIQKVGDVVMFKVVANSFLPHQVRNTIGLLLKIGASKLGHSDLVSIMEARTIGLAGPTAPACGLYLTRVNYSRPLMELIK